MTMDAESATLRTETDGNERRTRRSIANYGKKAKEWTAIAFATLLLVGAVGALTGSGWKTEENVKTLTALFEKFNAATSITERGAANWTQSL